MDSCSRLIIKLHRRFTARNFDQTVEQTALNTPCTKPAPRDHSSLPLNERTKKRWAIIRFALIGRNVARARRSRGLETIPTLILIPYSVRHRHIRGLASPGAPWLHTGFALLAFTHAILDPQHRAGIDRHCHGIRGHGCP